MLSKKELRIIVKEKREKIRNKEKLDEIITKKVLNSTFYNKADTIFMYVSYKNEVDTHNIIKYALKEGKRICVPKILSLKDGMKAVEINSFEELKCSSYGILEPDYYESNVIEEKDIDLLIMPGVAFDLKGGRVGYGGAFYDRFLKKTKASSKKVALAYSFQIFDKVPMEDNDMYIDSVITD